jgi:hypothetical protein
MLQWAWMLQHRSLFNHPSELNLVLGYLQVLAIHTQRKIVRSQPGRLLRVPCRNTGVREVQPTFGRGGRFVN